MSKTYLKEFIGFGVAGNFAHHLDQAGEASDFVNVKVDDKNAPKGIFPFYLPNSTTFLGIYPFSSTSLQYPQNLQHDAALQMEPEVALLCDIIYTENNKIQTIIPKFFTAFNDCSIRKPNAKKISEKKNWGKNTKGISNQALPIDTFEKGGTMDNYFIASFLKRDGVLHEYGENSAVLTYNYFYTQLKDWIIEKLNNQGENGPLENLANHLQNSNHPQKMIISIGATSYTKYGETTFLQSGDEIYVCVYDQTQHSFNEIKQTLINNKSKIEHASILHQTII